jgi:hypothetical protein
VRRLVLSPLSTHLIPSPSSFPGQEHVAGSYKIPTIMYYDKTGSMKVAGAEADSSAIIDLAEDEDWTKAELSVFYRESDSLAIQ